MATKPLFCYWRIRALGHPVNYLLEYLGVDYDEKRYEKSERLTVWPDDKEKLGADFPNLPYWKEGDRITTESRAIMKYLCRTRKPELLGVNLSVEAQTDIDIVDYFIYDFFSSRLVPAVYQDTEEVHKTLKAIGPVKMAYLEKFLTGKDWVAGKDITYVDFFTYEMLHHYIVYDAKALDNFPNLQAYMKRFESLPAIKRYMESPNFIKGPIFLYSKVDI